MPRIRLSRETNKKLADAMSMLLRLDEFNLEAEYGLTIRKNIMAVLKEAGVVLLSDSDYEESPLLQVYSEWEDMYDKRDVNKSVQRNKTQIR